MYQVSCKMYHLFFIMLTWVYFIRLLYLALKFSIPVLAGKKQLQLQMDSDKTIFVNN